MSQNTIEERVTRLEHLVDQLLQPKSATTQPGRDDWRKTFGMFAGDPVMKEIVEAGRRMSTNRQDFEKVPGLQVADWI